ncbi:hypothetical protein BDF20DRAFT_869100 [Mycotypha africana]|uniref:uncharacterized protein n=1 Tax=Mycotypha africana TaxID=64632 RepID=UPI002300AEA9|nr:uncharacterized protein BDF20DRAFT_869100 [Mycotypha africana]KAI8979356.1 hypothetical protein BDF20DRAFT_869100 [Mycotypha africana]
MGTVYFAVRTKIDQVDRSYPILLDHLKGLDDGSFNKNIYCSEETARLLPLIVNRHGRPLYEYLKDKLIPVPYNEAFKLPYKDEKSMDREVEVVLLSANHCIGSSM